MRFADEYGHYELSPFPGNGSVCISHGAFIKPWYRGKGHGKAQHASRLDQARKLGYTYIVATIRDDNTAEVSIVQKQGWRQLDDICDGEYGVSLWGMQL